MHASNLRSWLFGALSGLGIVLLLLGIAYFWWLPSSGREVRMEASGGAVTEKPLDFTTETPEPFESTSEGTPENLVLLIGDGMGFSQLTAARMALLGPNGRLDMERFPVTGWSATHSESEVYTDSAAGATALATGRKTDPRRISTDPDGRPLETLFEKARATGKGLGLITDSMLYDATTAAFAAHRDSRRDYLGIAEDVLGMRVEVLFGESRRQLDESAEWQALFDRYEEAGYARVGSADALADVPEGPVLGLFPHRSMAEARGGDGAPDLAALTTFALDRLGKVEAGFILLVETEETDSGSHNHDFERMVRGVGALDRAARVAVDFARRRGDTLVVATADHETGGLAILGGSHGEPQRVRWSTDSHTAEPVPVLAYGPGSAAFSGVHDNTGVGRLLARALFPSP